MTKYKAMFMDSFHHKSCSLASMVECYKSSGHEFECLSRVMGNDHRLLEKMTCYPHLQTGMHYGTFGARDISYYLL